MATTTAALGGPCRFRCASAALSLRPGQGLTRGKGLPGASLAGAIVQPVSRPARPGRSAHEGLGRPAAHLFQPHFIVSVQTPFGVVDENADSDVRGIHQGQFLPCVTLIPY
jgi:hypothetical protein